MLELAQAPILTNHMWDGFLILSNKRVWKGIPANFREIIERNISEHECNAAGGVAEARP